MGTYQFLNTCPELAAGQTLAVKVLNHIQPSEVYRFLENNELN